MLASREACLCGKAKQGLTDAMYARMLLIACSCRPDGLTLAGHLQHDASVTVMEKSAVALYGIGREIPPFC